VVHEIIKTTLVFRPGRALGQQPFSIAIQPARQLRAVNPQGEIQAHATIVRQRPLVVFVYHSRLAPAKG
jgi:3-hydroxymyristoyl/3-hydroxydecanoyl-(acyl carrier protein) dehydratase